MVGAALLLLLAVLLYNALFSFSYSVGPNYRNVSIDTYINITNALPEILQVTISDPITLSAGAITYIECNVSTRDWNGYADINFTDAYLYHSTSNPLAADDNNTHYTDSNCTVTQQGGYSKNFTCTFNVTYYALNGTWTCNATVHDNSSINDTDWNTTTINSMLALNISSTLLDFGQMDVGDTSANETLNITNIGNLDINVSLRGYGATEGDGLAFNCTIGNISIDNERYSLNSSHTWGQKVPLTSGFQPVQNLTITKQDTPGVLKRNTTYWQVYIPPNPAGECNGTIVFQAESAT